MKAKRWNWTWAPLAIALSGTSADAQPRPTGANATAVILAPSTTGRLGAWLLLGPFERKKLPDETLLAPSLSGGWKI